MSKHNTSKTNYERKHNYFFERATSSNNKTMDIIHVNKTNDIIHVKFDFKCICWDCFDPNTKLVLIAKFIISFDPFCVMPSE